MTTRNRIEWPAQTPPDDFADRVVRAALTERAAQAQDELAALGTADLASRTSLRPRSRRGRGAVAWLVAAAFGATVFVALLSFNKSQEAQRQQAVAAAALAAKEEQAKALQAQLRQAQAQIDGMLDQLAIATSDAQRAELKRKIEEEKAKQAAVRTRSGAAGGAKPTCKCTPGDPLCSCF